MVNQPRLDARDEAKEERALPFVGPPESIGSDPFVNVIYGGFYDDISDGSLCKNRSGEGPYELITNVRAAHGTLSS
jgi:hypothetical protein